MSRTKVKRHPERGVYERETIDAIFDEALVCHVGFVVDGQPFVIPTIHARVGDTLYIHGSPASRMLKTLADGVDVCVTATLVDGVVFARSWFHHSLNYRSAMVLGRAAPVVDPAEKEQALAAVVEHIAAGRSDDSRWPSAKELRTTEVLALEISEASAKVRTGPPKDAGEDLALPVWAGVLPLALVPGEPAADEHVPPGLEEPRYVAAYTRP